MRLGAPDDPLRSLWATEGAFRLLTLAYSLYIHASAVHSYTHPAAASCFIALQCIWSGLVAYALYAWPRWRPTLVGLDQIVTLGLIYVTWLVAPREWWDHNQSLPTTMWVANAVLCAGLLWGVRAGLASAVVLSAACLHVGGDLSWFERSPTWAILLSVGVAAGVGGLTVRRGAEQVNAALAMQARAAERERLAREVHDGVLQVLALMGRKGAEAGGEFAELGRLATEQERALRRLIAERDEQPLVPGRPASGGSHDGHGPTGARSGLALTDGAWSDEAGVDGDIDVRAALLALGREGVRVSTGAQGVVLDGHRARELLAVVRQAVVNAQHHAGDGASIFVLLEELGEEIVVTVRDDGVGMDPARLEEAEREGRLGVSRSIRGRITDLGGRADLHTAPGEGVEWEFTIPRA